MIESRLKYMEARLRTLKQYVENMEAEAAEALAEQRQDYRNTLAHWREGFAAGRKVGYELGVLDMEDCVKYLAEAVDEINELRERVEQLTQIEQEAA